MKIYKYRVYDGNMQLLCTIQFIGENAGIFLNKYFPQSENKQYWFIFVKRMEYSPLLGSVYR